MKRYKKGNALVLTTMVLFAVSIIAAGLTMYFYFAAIQNQNSNLYNQKHIELENQFNKTFEIMVKNGRISQNDGSEPLISSEAYNLESTKFFTFKNNGYDNTFEFVTKSDDKVVFTHKIETLQTMKSGTTRQYSLKKTLTVRSDSGYHFEILGEDYYATRL